MNNFSTEGEGSTPAPTVHGFPVRVDNNGASKAETTDEIVMQLIKNKGIAAACLP